ncbi:S8 family serine peptidase [uncultured Lacinutrix sp.]|uniref:S8 family serine peptidase n=1 Tax=uncultured Lacinutrix sp. TaxID=574032 RepID=UPI00261F29D1|nr:S8 family serine peptidase [uncultured Lacinutrix sp.]
MIQKIYISLGFLFFTVIQIQAQACQENINVSNGTVTGNQVVQATNSITATGVNFIGNTATVEYRAGFEITLLPDFDAINGANFDALIGICDGPFYNDPYIAKQWGHFNTINTLNDFNGNPISNLGQGTDVFGAWDITKGVSNITVAILDSGLNINHLDIDNTRIVNGYNFVDGTSNYEDLLGHGTLVTGILGATPNNGEGVAGVDWNCNIMPLKVISGGGAPNDLVDSAIRHAILYGANIVTMSFGNHTATGNTIYDIEKERTFGDAIDAGLLLFAAAGNDNGNSMDYPAKYPSIAGVGALSPCDERKSSTSDSDGGSCDQDSREDHPTTNWGSNYGIGLDFLAPGTLLPSTDVMGITEGYSQYDIYESVENGNYILDTYGTSMSSPFAAGIAALVWSMNSNLKNYQVLHIMQETARDIAPNNPNEWDEETGYGALNAKAAVEMAETFNPNSDFLLPNLTLEFTSNPNEIIPGEDLIIKFKVKNTGDKIAEASVLKYAFGTNINTINVPALNSQQTSNEYTITIPILIEECYLLGDTDMVTFEVDTTEEVTEFNEFNRFKHTFQIISKPDLTIESPMVSNVQGNEYLVSYQTKNSGFTKAQAPNQTLLSFNKYYASVDNQFDGESTDPLIVDSSRFGLTLCPGSSIPLSTISLTIPSGFNYVLLQIDAQNIINESNESNNLVALELNQFNSSKKENVKQINLIDLPIAIEVIPNPIKDSGIIKYNLEKESTVSISISDLAGFNSNIILAETKQVKGNYEIPIYKSNLRTGIYIIEIIVNEKKFYKKIIIR